MTLDDFIAELDELRRQVGHGFREVLLEGDGGVDKVSLDSDAVVVTGYVQHDDDDDWGDA